MDKKRKGKGPFKSLKPIDMDDFFQKEFSNLDIGSGLGNLPGTGREKLFLNTFTVDDLYEILVEVNLVKHLEQIGFNDLKLSIDKNDALVNSFKIYYNEINTKNLLIDLRLSQTKFMPDKKFFKEGTDITIYDMIVIEWLSASNPVAEKFSNKPQLPGQTKPGLGVLKYCFEMMYLVAKKISSDGFLDIPDHIHGAIMYSKKFNFFDPVHDAILQCIKRDLKDYSLSDISWGVLTKTIIDTYKDEPLVYDPSEQIYYVSQRLRKYFNSSKYKSTFNKYYKRKKYSFDYDLMVKKREEILKTKNIINL